MLPWSVPLAEVVDELGNYRPASRAPSPSRERPGTCAKRSPQKPGKCSRRNLVTERIALDDEGDVTVVPTGSWATWTSNTTLLEVVGSGGGTAREQPEHRTRQPMYEDAWESFKRTTANR